jgi:hypothetical protein
MSTYSLKPQQNLCTPHCVQTTFSFWGFERRNDNNKVLQVTGLHFTTFNFTNMFGNLSSRESENRQSLRLNAAADWNWRNLVGTVDQIHRQSEIAEQNTVLEEIAQLNTVL